MSRLLLCLAAVFAAGLSAAFADDWPQFQHDDANTGRSLGPAVEAPYRARWIWWGEDNLSHLADRDIPIGGHPPPPERETFAKLSFTMQVVVADGRAIFGDLDGKVFCLSAADGSTVWKKQLGGAVVHAPAILKGERPEENVVLVAGHDGALKGLAWSDGRVLWTFRARKPFVTPVKLAGGVAFVGSLDGRMVAVRARDGEKLWTFDARAPIRQPAAVARGKVFFGSEDMIFHALDAATGQEVWRTAKGLMKGQSFRNTWPLVAGDKVLTFQILVDGHAEFVMETLLWHATPGAYDRKDIKDWPKEREAILKWLRGDLTYCYDVGKHWQKDIAGKRLSDKIDPAMAGGPFRKTLHVFTVDGDGNGGAVEPYQVPLGIVGGTGNGNMHALDANGRPVTWWRVSARTIITGGGFGTGFSPDLSALDLATGDRLPYPRGRMNRHPGMELDNHHMLTTAGDVVYYFNPFRQARWIRLDGDRNPGGNISAVYRRHDGGGWTGDLIYFPEQRAAGRRGVDSHGAGRTPVVIAGDALFLNELDIRAVACFESRRPAR